MPEEKVDHSGRPDRHRDDEHRDVKTTSDDADADAVEEVDGVESRQQQRWRRPCETNDDVVDEDEYSSSMVVERGLQRSWEFVLANVVWIA